MKNTIKAYAKINVGLSLLFKRSDNYHQLESVMLATSLCDNITIEETDKDEVIIKSNKKFIHPKKNLIYLISMHLKREFNITTGLNIYLEKNIPVSAGMGGGSSDAAAILNYLIDIWNINYTSQQKIELAASFGADIPFSVFNKPSHVKGIGEILEHFEFEPFFSVIVVEMPYKVSTKLIFDQFDFQNVDFPNITEIKNSLVNNDKELFIKYLDNNMESVTTHIHPQINVMKEELLHLGCFASTMSGSGPTVLGFVDKDTNKEIIEKLESRGFKAHYVSIIKTNTFS